MAPAEPPGRGKGASKDEWSAHGGSGSGNGKGKDIVSGKKERMPPAKMPPVGRSGGLPQPLC